MEEDYTRPGWLPRATGYIPAPVKDVLARVAIAIARRSRAEMFRFDGRTYSYFFHPYNLAWKNERTVEIPIVSAMLSEYHGEVLEVGNVLSHYIEVDHDIVDKYEVAPGVVNQDITIFNPGKLYDLIISVSTVEHIGVSERPRNPGKAADAVAHLGSLLAPGGRLVVTIPVGLNEELDGMILRQETPFTELKAMRRVSHRNEWEEIDSGCAWSSGYCGKGYRANAVVICYCDRSVEELA